MLSGPIPTPAVANLTQSMRADAGVVISASHNPFADNGIKIFGPDGFKLPDAEEAAIESAAGRIRSSTRNGHTGGAHRPRRARRRRRGPLRRLRQEHLPARAHARRPAASWSTPRTAPPTASRPAVFAELGADVTALGCTPNGQNINRNCGALHPEHVVERGQEDARRAIGIALDGDADRVIIVDEKGADRRRRRGHGAVRDAPAQARPARQEARWSPP